MVRLGRKRNRCDNGIVPGPTASPSKRISSNGRRSFIGKPTAPGRQAYRRSHIQRWFRAFAAPYPARIAAQSVPASPANAMSRKMPGSFAPLPFRQSGKSPRCLAARASVSDLEIRRRRTAGIAQAGRFHGEHAVRASRRRPYAVEAEQVGVHEHRQRRCVAEGRHAADREPRLRAHERRVGAEDPARRAPPLPRLCGSNPAGCGFRNRAPPRPAPRARGPGLSSSPSRLPPGNRAPPPRPYTVAPPPETAALDLGGVPANGAA